MRNLPIKYAHEFHEYLFSSAVPMTCDIYLICDGIHKRSSDPYVFFWKPPHARSYTCTLINILQHTLRRTKYYTKHTRYVHAVNTLRDAIIAMQFSEVTYDIHSCVDIYSQKQSSIEICVCEF